MLYTSMTNSFIITESAVTSPIYAWPPPLHASHVRYHRKSQLISWHTISFMGQTAYRLTHAHNPSYILKTPCAHTHTAHCQPHKHNPVCMYPQTSWSNSQGAQSSTLIQHRAHLIRPDIPKVLSQDSHPRLPTASSRVNVSLWNSVAPTESSGGGNQWLPNQVLAGRPQPLPQCNGLGNLTIEWLTQPQK